MTRTTGRRALLKKLGVGAALAPFFPLLARELAAAPAPRRLILLFTPNGTVLDRWAPTGAENDFTLSPILKPLEPHRSDLLILDGIDKESARHGPGEGHMMGMGHLWTGTELLPGKFTDGSGTPAGWAGGMSVDQRVARAFEGQTRIGSLELGVQTDANGADVWARMIYRGADQPVPPENNPAAAFDRLFGGVVGDGSAAARLRAEQKSVLDVVKAELSSTTPKLGADERRKFDAHLEALRAFERSLTTTASACVAPPKPTTLDPKANDNYPALTQRHIDLLVAALACDQTRVASLQWSYSRSSTVFRWLGARNGHHTLSHDPDTNLATKDLLTAINTWYAQQMAALLTKLKETSEGGGRLLDNTLVVWGNELARGNTHTQGPTPFVLAGRAGGTLRTGRALRYDKVPHNNLLVSICQAMGLGDVRTFGNPKYCSGALPGLGT